VVVGAGFGGLQLVKHLNHTDYNIILIDKTNHHLFQPLLYQVAMSALSPADISAPIRTILKNSKNLEVIMGEVQAIDRKTKSLYVNGASIDYDTLVIAAGAKHAYFGHDEWEAHAPGLKTLADALAIRGKMLISFEEAESNAFTGSDTPPVRFVVVGGGPTGVELAGALAEIARKTLRHDFKTIDTSKTEIILIEGADRLLTAYDEPLNQKALKDLTALGVKVRLNTIVTNIDETGVYIGDEKIETRNVIWAAGNTASPVIASLETETDRAGRAVVNPDCTLPDDPEVFVIGDAALFTEKGKPLPGIAPVAMQQGRYVAKLLKRRLKGKNTPPFKYFNRGSMATIGRARAVFQAGNIKISGFFAWFLWVFIHIMYLIGFRNRYRVMAEWMWYYLSYKPGARLITTDPYRKPF